MSIYRDSVALKLSPNKSTIVEEANPLLLSVLYYGSLTKLDNIKGAKTTTI